MSNFTIDNNVNMGITAVSDTFIRDYLPGMSSGYIKVYLYLLMFSKYNSEGCIERLADTFETTQRDVIQTLKALASLGLIDLYFKNDNISGIKIVNLDNAPAKVYNEPTTIALIPESSAQALQNSSEPVPEIKDNFKSVKNFEVNDFKDADDAPIVLDCSSCTKEDISDCMNCIEIMVGTTLGQSHFDFISFLMNDLNFSIELVTALYETAKERGKMSINYLNTIALDWSHKGIKTPQEAKNAASNHSGLYKTVATTLGINRTLAPAEMDIVNSWKEYKFDTSIIEEACNRTVLQSGSTNLNYTSKILKDWYSNGVKTLSDIEEIDRTFYKQRNVSASSSNAPVKKNRFQNHPQRNYSSNEASDMEKKLLNNK